MEAAFTKRALIFGSISAFFVTNYTAFLYLRKNNPIFVRETFWPAFLNSSYHFLLCFVVSKLLIPDPIQETRPFTQLIPQTITGQSDLVILNNPNVREDVERATAKGTFTNRPKADGPTTLPSFNPVKPTEPYWGNLRPFVLASGDVCAPPPPPLYSEERGSAFRIMAEQFHDSVKALTPAQKEIALFWADNPVATGTPGFHWISVVNQMVTRRSLDAESAVELYTLTSLASWQADLKAAISTYVHLPTTSILITDVETVATALNAVEVSFDINTGGNLPATTSTVVNDFNSMVQAGGVNNAAFLADLKAAALTAATSVVEATPVYTVTVDALNPYCSTNPLLQCTQVVPTNGVFSTPNVALSPVYIRGNITIPGYTSYQFTTQYNGYAKLNAAISHALPGNPVVNVTAISTVTTSRRLLLATSETVATYEVTTDNMNSGYYTNYVQTPSTQTSFLSTVQTALVGGAAGIEKSKKV
jgi:hypothetical protein